MNDLVSIIMPAYNTSRYIGEAINSILAQTYTNWELIIVDDCSTDNTKDIVMSRKDTRIKYFCNEKNSGAAVSRNRALREAKGKWIAFLDSDDIWLPEKLTEQIAFMEVNSYLFSCTDYEIVDETGKSIGKYVTGYNFIDKQKMLQCDWIGLLTAMYDAEAIGTIQVADIKKRNDYAMWLKVIEKADCHRLNKTLAKYRKRHGSLSNASFYNLIKHQYLMFHVALEKNCIESILFTAQNVFFTAVKKNILCKKIYTEGE